jgi:hypothetical protein
MSRCCVTGLPATCQTRFSAAWNAIPFNEFDSLCQDLEAEHGRAIELYRQYLRASEARRLQ